MWERVMRTGVVREQVCSPPTHLIKNKVKTELILEQHSCLDNQSARRPQIHRKVYSSIAMPSLVTRLYPCARTQTIRRVH